MANKYKSGDKVWVKRTNDPGREKDPGREGVIEYAFPSGLYYDVRFSATTPLEFFLEKEIKPLKESKMTTTTSTSNPSAEAFFRAASKALVKVARANKTFTTDDLWAVLAKTNPGGFNVEPRLLGGFMVEASKGGSIATTTRYKPSNRPECHKRPLRVWKSLIFVSK